MVSPKDPSHLLWWLVVSGGLKTQHLALALDPPPPVWVYGFVQEDRENVFFKFTTRINIHRKVLSRKPLHHVKVTFHAGDFATLNNT